MKSRWLTSLLLLACVLFFGGTGFAAEGTSSFNWTGPYVGLHVGYGWGSGDSSFTPLPSSGPLRFGLNPGSISPDASGVLGGLQAGYNYQVQNFVFGIEADFSGSGISGTRSAGFVDEFGFGGVLASHQTIEWFGTVRPRVGYVVTPPLLLYATGGLAYGNVDYAGIVAYDGGNAYSSYVEKTKVGWTVGGGAEYAIAKHWTVKAEYLYMDLGSTSATSNVQNVGGTKLPGRLQMGYDDTHVQNGCELQVLVLRRFKARLFGTHR